MPSNNFYPTNLDPRGPVPQEKIKEGKLPKEIGQVASQALYGTIVDKYDEDKDTNSLYGKIRTYNRMKKDPTVGGALQGYENILSLVEWNVEPVDREKAGLSDEEYDEEIAQEYRNFVQSCFDDMVGTSIADIVASALEMLAIGHQITIPQFKIRSGYNDNVGLRSKYDDGRIGWKSWKSINSDSVERWLVPDGGGYADLNGFVQDLVNGGYQDVPRNRMLLFRTTSKGDTIEGESILYSAVSTWQRLQRVLEIEDVSLSRNLEGIPYLRMPSRFLSKDATDGEASLRDAMLRMVKAVKYNEQTALVTPSDTDENGNRLIDLELLTAGPNVRVDQCRAVAAACEQLIAESVLANFLKLGSGGGSYAMSSSLQDMFVLAMKKYLNNISSVINEEAIPTLMRLNGMDLKYAPELVHKGLDTDSIGVFIDALMKSIAAGAVVPSKGIQRSVLEKLKLPTEGADSAWEEVEELQRRVSEQSLENQGINEEGDSNLDEIEETGVELSPEPVQKNLFEHNGQFYDYTDGKLINLSE